MNKLVEHPAPEQKSPLKPQKYRQFSLIILLLIILSILPIILIRQAINQASVFYGVNFPNGELSFADEVVAYKPIIYFNQDGLANVSSPFNNPRTALGIPNSSNPKNPFLDLSKRNDVSLGFGGSLTLAFKNNLLTGSGNDHIDLWIFEAGEKIESVNVEISKDGKVWHSVGEINQKQNGIDIDQFGWTQNDFFAYVRLTDNPQNGEHDGIWNDGEWLGWGGADIDAVGAISSVSLIPSAKEPSSLADPILKWGLWLVIASVVSFIVSFFLRKVIKQV
jgi:hypothetical protein